ncbi:alpha-2-macroglobulin-like isoform X2 [Apostichopus japonicus]|uniref:alpha-2-macroglobulin-like isoform X2 n=1 Tax=Stichopus japonicus TaxID=307972 RepID=UPI003AB50CF5
MPFLKQKLNIFSSTLPSRDSIADNALKGFYLITVPKILVAGSTEDVLVTIFEPLEPINVWVLLSVNGETIAEESSVVSDAATYSLEIPEMEDCSSIFGSLTVHLKEETAIAWTVREERRLTIRCDNRDTIVQTDKAIYKPGQTVFFRILSLDPNFLPDLRPVESIWIQAPNDVRVAQWDNEARQDTGLIDLSFPMTSDPVLGKWKINVLFRGVVTIQEFVVEEYVLPRFDVIISVQSYVLITDEILPVTVCGIYSYGKPVQGEVSISVGKRAQTRFVFATEPPAINDVDDGDVITAKANTGDDGCVNVDIDISSTRIRFRGSFSIYSNVLHVSAELTESASGISRSTDSKNIEVTTRPRQMMWISEESFKPGLPYSASIKVELPDGSPAVNTLVEPQCSQGGQTFYTESLYTDLEGYANFLFDTQPELLDPIYCSPTFPSFPLSYQYNRLMLLVSSMLNVQLYSDSLLYVSVCVYFHWQPTFPSFPLSYQYNRLMLLVSSMLNVQLYSDSLLYVSVCVYFHWQPTFPSFPLSYQYNRTVYTLDPFRQSINLEALYSPSASYMQFKPVLGELLAGEKAKLILQYITTGSDDMELTDLKIQVLARGNVINVPVKIGGDPSKIDATNGSYYYEVSLSLELTPRMSPRAQIVAFFIRDDLEVITASLSFNIAQTFQNKVDIKFQSEEVSPGDFTNLNINGDPGSLCAIGIVDRSVVLLGGDNRITTTKVFSSIEKYLLSEDGGYRDGPPSCVEAEYQEYDIYDYRIDYLIGRNTEEPDVNKRKKRQLDYFFPRFGSSYPKYKDASKAFVDSGLIYISNLLIETSPCNQYYPRAYAFADQVAEFNTVEDVESEPSQRVRTYFPETWLWDLYPVGTSGSTSVIVQAPDTITDWVGSGFCLNKDSGLGISEQVTIRAFQAFFIDLNIPYSVIRGEEIPIDLSVFSYLTDCLVVEVTLQGNPHFALLEDDSKFVCVCNGAVGVQFYIQPLLLGNIPIQLDAVSVNDVNGICGEAQVSAEVGTQDSIRRDLLVEAEGVEEEQAHTSYFCPQDYESGIFLDTAALLLPENYVPDSASGKMTVIGDLLGPTLSNLENLIRIPSGCGEQNMLGLVPNIYVLLYFINSDQNNVAIETKARENILIGYQKELKFRHADGSYSAFGSYDGEGSAWLTAFVVRSFAQAQNFVTIDEKDLLVSVRWLSSLQDSTTGCFRNRGRVIHKAMQGGVNDEITLTAYILLAICETGIDLQDETIVNGIQCLEVRVDNITDNYAIALVTFALVKMRSYRAIDIFEKLEDAAIRDQGLVHWKSNREDIPSFTHYYQSHNPAIQVEITAYALLSYLAYYELSDAITESSPIVKWLIQQQNPYGGFSSTQDTVVGLQVLAEYAALVYAGDQDIQVTVVASPPCEVSELSISNENKFVLQEQTIQVLPTFVQIAAVGTGCAIGKVSWKYNVFPETRNDAPFTLNHTIIPVENEVSKYHITICASYTGNDKRSNMALVENKPQSGFTLVEDSLTGLITDNLKQVDLEKGRVIVYFQELTYSGDCVSYDVEKSFNVQLARKGILTVFDYYEKDLVTSVLYYIEEPDNSSLSLNKCPICSHDIPDNFEELLCSSKFVYKALVGQRGNLQLYGNLKDDGSSPANVPIYLALEFPEGCNCDLVKAGSAVLVVDDFSDIRRDDFKPNLGYLSLESSSAVISWDFRTRRAANMALAMCT